MFKCIKNFIKNFGEIKMKNIILVLSIIVLSYINSESATFNASIDLDNGVYGEYYKTVHIECNESGCFLVCRDPIGPDICTWAGATWCEGCQEEKTLFQTASGQELYDYAKDQINNNVLTGTYTNNLVAGPKTYYRTITWTADLITQKAELELTITE